MPGLDHFSFIAPYYDRVIRLHTAERIIELAGLPIDGGLLDAGGGTGRVAQALHDHAGWLVVVDLSLGMLQQASTKHRLSSVCSPTEQLPFPDATFERIIMVDALHHVIDHGATARELWRVLKAGGRILIEEPDIRTFSVKLVALAEKLALMRSHFISPSRIAGLFPYPEARLRVERDGFNAWIVVDKCA